MYRKFLFHHQPDRQPWHPDYEIQYSGVYICDIDGNIEIEQLYINSAPYPVAPKFAPGCGASKQWRDFLHFLKENAIQCDSDESQDRIVLPAGNMYDEMRTAKRRSSRESNAVEVAVPFGILN